MAPDVEYLRHLARSLREQASAASRLAGALRSQATALEEHAQSIEQGQLELGHRHVWEVVAGGLECRCGEVIGAFPIEPT